MNKMSVEEKQWQAEGDLRTLTQADEIKGSKARLSAARAEAKRQMNSLRKTVGGKQGKAKKGSQSSYSPRRVVKAGTRQR